MTTRYTSEHEWINRDADSAATVGITQHAQDALGDIVFVDLPTVGTAYKKGDGLDSLGAGDLRAGIFATLHLQIAVLSCRIALSNP